MLEFHFETFIAAYNQTKTLSCSLLRSSPTSNQRASNPSTRLSARTIQPPNLIIPSFKQQQRQRRPLPFPFPLPRLTPLSLLIPPPYWKRRVLPPHPSSQTLKKNQKMSNLKRLRGLVEGRLNPSIRRTKMQSPKC